MAKDQLYLVKLVFHEADGERLSMLQLASRNDDKAKTEAAKHFKKAVRIVSVEPKTLAEIEAAIKELSDANPGRPSVHELTGGQPIQLLADPELAAPADPLGL